MKAKAKRTPTHLTFLVLIDLVFAGWLMLAVYVIGSTPNITPDQSFIVGAGYGLFGVVIRGVLRLLVDTVYKQVYKFARVEEHDNQGTDG